MAEIEKAAKAGKTSNSIMVAEGNRLGTTFEIADRIEKLYPNLETKVTILGHIQRGGSPTCYDRILASKLGVAAVEGLLNGKTDVMVGTVGGEIAYTFLQKAIQNKAPLNMELLRISKILAT